jgi:hypothetical protein
MPFSGFISTANNEAHDEAHDRAHDKAHDELSNTEIKITYQSLISNIYILEYLLEVFFSN